MYATRTGHGSMTPAHSFIEHPATVLLIIAAFVGGYLLGTKGAGVAVRGAVRAGRR